MQFLNSVQFVSLEQRVHELEVCVSLEWWQSSTFDALITTTSTLLISFLITITGLRNASAPLAAEVTVGSEF